MLDRIAVLAAVTDLIILRRRPGGVLRVGIDGVDGSGKSVLGDEFASTLRARGLTVVRASVDGFHRPVSERYRRGRRSPHGYYEDSFDYGALHRELLDPLGANGSRLCRTAVYDVARECGADVTPTAVPDGSVLVLDGIFVHRPELRDVWDLSLFVRVPFEVSVPRGAGRGYGHPDLEHPSNSRYVEGQRHYLALCDPESRADVVLDNTDLARPFIVEAHRPLDGGR